MGKLNGEGKRARGAPRSIESIVFATPEQRIIRHFLSEPTTALAPRVIASRLKGTRGLGGVDGIEKIVGELVEAGILDSVDNGKSARLRDENHFVRILKTLAAVCDLDDWRRSVEPFASRVILYGSHAEGNAASSAEYELLVVARAPDEVKRVSEKHPLAKRIRLVVCTSDGFEGLEERDPALLDRVTRGIEIAR